MTISVIAGLILIASGAHANILVDFEGIPDTYLHSGGNQNLNGYYPGLSFGSQVTILDKVRYGYNSGGYPPHSGDAVIFSYSDPYIRVDFVGFTTNYVEAWYTSYYTFYLEAYDASNNLLASSSGLSNYGTNSLISVSTGARNIAYVKFHDLGNYFTVDDLAYSVIHAPSLSGTVRDQTTGNPIVGAMVTIPAKPTTQTDAAGQFSFYNLSSGQTSVSVTQTGYYPVTQTVNISNNSTTYVDIYMMPQATGTNPVVVDVRSQYCNQAKHVYYLNGVSLNETFMATIDWKGKTPGQVKWILPNGTTRTDTVSGNVSSQPFDMGSIGLGKLTVTAIAADSTQSEPKNANFNIVPPPPGIPLGALIPNFLGGNCLRYSTKYTVGFVKEGVEEGVVPDKVWGFGGYAFEFVAMVSLSVEVSGDGTASAIVEVPLDWDRMKLAGAKIKPKMSGSLKWQYSSEQQKWLSGGSFLIGVLVNFTTPPYYGVIPFPPYLVYLRGALKVDLSSGFSLEDWAHDGKPILKGVIILDPSVAIIAGAGVADIFAIEGCGEAKGHMLLIFPNENPLEELSCELNIKIIVVAWIFHQEYNLAHYKWSLLGKEGAPALMPLGATALERFNAGQFQIMNRNYLSPDYAIWAPTVPEKPKRLTTFGVEAQTPPEPNEEEILQYNIFSQSQPTLAADGNDLLLAWIYDDPNRDPGDPNSVNRTELLFSSCRNGNWSDPIPIDNDGTADFSPQLVTLPNGNALCVWENANQVLPKGATLTDMSAAMEIKAAYYDKNSGLWSAHALTNNTHLDRSPRIAAAENNTAIAVWIYNEKDDLLGLDPNALNNIRFSKWNGSNWSEPSTIATNIGLIIKTALTYNGNKAVYVYSLDLDHNWQTDTDRELYAITYDGATWLAPTRLTTDNLLDANPQVTYDQDDVLLIWYRDANLVSCRNFNLNTIQNILTTSGSSGSMDFRLTKSPTGQISLVWTDTSLTGVDIFTATYDSCLSVWSHPYQLTSDRSMERSVAATYAGSDELALAYNKVEIIDHNGIPEPNRVDLYVLRHKIKADLAITSSGISFGVPNPPPGSIVDINAVIHNLGDIAEVNVPVAFYNGNPGTDGVLIGNVQKIVGPILAGSTAVASVQWSVPEVNEPQHIYVVIDPQYTLEDAHRNNNIASVSAMAPDVTIEEIGVQKAGPNTIITVRVANEGVLPVTDVDVVVRKQIWHGAVLGEDTISDIAPGAYRDVSFVWSDVPMGASLVCAEVDTSDSIDEFDEDNNLRYAQVENFSASDFNHNAEVDLTDLAKFAAYWLNEDCNNSGWCGNTDMDLSGVVNFVDWALFADDWMRHKGQWLKGDFDLDSIVDFFDYAEFAAHWQQDSSSPGWREDYDINKNSRVDFGDLNEFLANWLVSE